MSKGREELTNRSDALPDEETRRSYGLFAVLAILTVVGIAIWFLVNQNTD